MDDKIRGPRRRDNRAADKREARDIINDYLSGED